MALHDDIAAHSNGAHFLRGDLHIHSYGRGGSYDVKDAGMTPQAVVDLAIAERLHVIAITDHNVVGNVRAAAEHGAGKDVLVVPGIELSTSDGHLLVYCPTVDQLEGFYGKLDISANKQACMDSMSRCLNYAAEFGGFGICAHVDQESGLEQAHPKFDAFKQEILNCGNLLALEVTQATNHEWFCDTDVDNDRRNCAKIRRTTLGHEVEVSLAKVMGSDSHSLASIGKNANNQKRLTRFKMESLTFDSLRIALLDCSARVRLEDLLPTSIPHFVGMKLEGGFLKDQVIHFSRNLTCIIGGRGAGKSTMLESLRAASGNGSDHPIVDSDVWPDCISLIYQDEVGQQHQLTRSKLSDLTNPDPNGPLWLGIESYGQGETASTIHNCDKDPAILLSFLDGFVNLKEMTDRDEQIRDELLENQKEIEQFQGEINRIKDVEALKKTADSQLAVLKTQNAVEVVQLEEKLAAERAFREKLRKILAAIPAAVTSGMNTDELKELVESIDGSTLAVGKPQFDVVSAVALGLVTKIEGMANIATTMIKTETDKINTQLGAWVTEQQKTKDRIEDIRRELEKQKIKLDMAFIRKVTNDATTHAAKLIELRKNIPKQAAAFKVRSALMQERRVLKSRLFTTREAFATRMNKNLESCVVDYVVHLKFADGVLSKELEELVKTAMNWRTSQVPKAALIAANLTPIALFDAVDKQDTKPLLRILDDDKAPLFSANEALEIIAKLREWDNYVALQRCPFEDRPEIKVTKMITLPNGKRVPNIKDFTRLSLGQQQSILLTVLLFSQSTAPLIIDQPEDNLDSEFVYTTLVRALRGIKEKRQVIIVTHNANIAVLGDAELIIPLRGQSEYSVVRDRGSIDRAETKELVCTILEGSRKAFKRRREIYGI